MSLLFMKNVGSGQHIFVFNENHSSYIVDFGFGNDVPASCYNHTNCPLEEQRYYDLPTKFFLSHFHADHFNGLFRCQNVPCMGHITDFYYPYFAQGLYPLFQNYITLNIALACNGKLSDVYRFLHQLLTRNGGNMTFTALSDNMTVNDGENQIDVLWPQLGTANILQKGDIEQYNRRCDEIIHEHNSLNLLKVFVGNIIRDREEPFQLNMDRIQVIANIVNLNNDDDILNNIASLAKQFKDKLNKNSLAFRIEDNVLFLGDLEATQINSIVNNLPQNKRNYQILIAAHHGTHYGNKLKMLTIGNTIVSIGSTLYSTKNGKTTIRKYNQLRGNFSCTYNNGDIILPY